MSEANENRNKLVELIKQKATLSDVPMLLPANPFFDLAGEEFGRRLLLTNGVNDVEYCLRPEFTLPIAIEFLASKKTCANIGYIGKIFRQRANGPSEFLQAGIEFLGQENRNETLEQMFDFAVSATKVYNIKPQILLGSVEIFESILEQINIAKVWLPRIRHRFGHADAMSRLLERLSDPHGASAGAGGSTGSLPWKEDELISVISDQMIAAGLSLTGSRTPQEIANRYFEKQQLNASTVPSEIIGFLQNYLNINGEANSALEQINILANDFSLDLQAPLNRLLDQIALLKNEQGLEEILFDASFSPALDYYTGIVFELKNNNETLASGGEYNRLLERLGAATQINATGCSLWIDRLEGAENE